MRTKCIIFGEALRIRIKKFEHNLPENYSKSTKIAITVCKFSKLFRGSMPPTHNLFLFLNQLEISCAEKKNAGKNVEIMPPLPLLKFLATPLPALIVGEENLVISFRPHPFRNTSAIAGVNPSNTKFFFVLVLCNDESLQLL